MRSSRVWMRSSRLLEIHTDCQCQCRNSPGFNATTQWHLGGGAADEAVLNKVLQKAKRVPIKKNLVFGKLSNNYRLSNLH
jgi:hypothetical protein